MDSILVCVGLYTCMQLEETPVLSRDRSWVEVLTVHRRSSFTAVELKLSEISCASIGTVFAISYVTDKLAMRRT